MTAVKGWLMSCAAPATKLPSEASFSFCTSSVCKRFWLSYDRRDSCSKAIRAWSWTYCRRNTNAPNSNIATSTVEMRNTREGSADLSDSTVHTPNTGRDRSASMASRGTSFLNRAFNLNSWLCRSHCPADNAAAAIHATVPMTETSYRIPECTWMVPGLSTIQQPVTKLAHHAVSIVMKRIEERERRLAPSEPIHIQMQTRFVPRKSIGHKRSSQIGRGH